MIAFADRLSKPDKEVSIRPNVSAISMEEVTPIAVSDGQLVAPEEVYQSKGNKELKVTPVCWLFVFAYSSLLAMSFRTKNSVELSQEERKRLRAHKKKRRKHQRGEKEAQKRLSLKLDPNGASKNMSKKAALKAIQREQVSLTHPMSRSIFPSLPLLFAWTTSRTQL